MKSHKIKTFNFLKENTLKKDQHFFKSLLSIDEDSEFDYQSSIGNFCFSGSIVYFEKGDEFTYFYLPELRIKESKSAAFLKILKTLTD
ncbi:MAG: hypothetical protein MI922_02140 [Bacteroidales bacterium]|nr:hypothetical protein [Bacteroidales bacterium]